MGRIRPAPLIRGEFKYSSGSPDLHTEVTFPICTLNYTMATYEAFDRGVEVNGQTVLTIVEEAMGRFSDEYRDRALDALAAEGITDPDPQEWYPQQTWLNAFETIAEELQPHVLDRLGEQLPAVAAWPNDFDSVAAGLRSIDEVYQRNHRGGDIGYYEFERTEERAGELTEEQGGSPRLQPWEESDNTRHEPRAIAT